MNPLGYPGLTGRAVIPLDRWSPTDSASTHEARQSGYVFARDTSNRTGDVLPYKETRTKDMGNPEGWGNVVDVLMISEGEPEVRSYTVAHLVNLVAGQDCSRRHQNLHAAIVFIKKGQLNADCIQQLTSSFSLLPQFWDIYGTASIIDSESAMVTELREIPADGITAHFCHPLGIVRETKPIEGRDRRRARDSEIQFCFNTPSFFIKWQRSDPAPTKSNNAAPEVLLLCLLSPKANYEELKKALTQAYSDPTARAVLREDPYGLIGVIMVQWLAWSQELFYQLEQLVFGIESDLEDDPRIGRSAKAQAKEVNFSEMHHIAKHIIQYLDSLQVTVRLQDSVIQCHEKLWRARDLNTNDSPAFQRVKDALQYCDLALIGVKSRVEGLKHRMDNQIALGFNLVQQRDAQLAQSTNKVMYCLSLVTFAFLPLTAVASVLATPYFSVHDADLTWVGSGYPLAWAIGTPLLLALVGLLLCCAYVYHESVRWPWRRKAMVTNDGGNAV